MKLNPSIFILLLATVVFSGCQTIDHRKPISREDATSYKTEAINNQNEGYLIGSFSYFGHHPSRLAIGAAKNFRYNNYRLRYKSTDQREIPIQGNVGGDGSFIFKHYKEDYDLSEGEGQVFVIALPEGSYEFSRFSFYLDEIVSQKTWYSGSDMSIPFKIEKRESTYIGEIRFNHLWGKNILGMTLPDGCYLEAIDEYSRDIKLIHEHYPFTRDLPTKNINITISKGLKSYYIQASSIENQAD